MSHEPIAQFMSDWAKAKDCKDPNVSFCTLATISEEGDPVARMLALRDVDLETGSFLLYTNDTSPKLRHLEANSKFQLLTFWNQPTMMQYRIKGHVWKQVSREEMEQGWKKKAKTSQLLDYYYAKYQPQSSVLKGGREEFVATMKNIQQEFADKEVPFQTVAMGLLFEADTIEEWRGSVVDRLHERYLYQRTDSGSWKKEALVP